MPDAIKLDPKSTAVVAIDMHRGHLDPAVATLPLASERCGPLIARSRALFSALRGIGVPIVHVVTVARDTQETMANPFWDAIANDPADSLAVVSYAGWPTRQTAGPRGLRAQASPPAARRYRH